MGPSLKSRNKISAVPNILKTQIFHPRAHSSCHKFELVSKETLSVLKDWKTDNSEILIKFGPYSNRNRVEENVEPRTIARRLTVIRTKAAN